MKRFDELTPEQKQKAVHKCQTNLLEAILEGALRFDDGKNGNGLQARIEQAFHDAEELKTPWFASEYIMETCGDDIRGMAECDAEDAVYVEKHENVIKGIL